MGGHVSPIEFWSDLSREPNFKLLSTAEVEEGEPLPEGLETLGKQTREAYERLVGGSKVLLGMGFPPISPSVYTALYVPLTMVTPGARLIAADVKVHQSFCLTARQNSICAKADGMCIPGGSYSTEWHIRHC
jgi:hypothetical protein